MPSANEALSQSGVESPNPVSGVGRTVEALEAQDSDTHDIVPRESIESIAPSPSRLVERRSRKPKSPSLEEWVAERLGSDVLVRCGSSGTLIVSRAKLPIEPLPLFEEAIVLGNLRAVVRSSGVQQASGVTYRNGVASISIQEPLKSLAVVELVSKVMDFSEVSEVRVQSRSGS